MDICFENLELELVALKPKIVFLLGKKTSDFILNKYDKPILKANKEFEYLPHRIGSTYFVPIHHPSYVLIYKRNYIKDYIKGIKKVVSKINFRK